MNFEKRIKREYVKAKGMKIENKSNKKNKIEIIQMYINK